MNAIAQTFSIDPLEQAVATQSDIVPLNDFELDYVSGGDGVPDWG